FSAGLFLTAKFLRFLLFMIFLLALFQRTSALSGYSIEQMLFIYLTYTCIDTTTQLFFREAYRFRPMVVSGDFDLVLVKPISPLFRALAGGADPLDLCMLVPYVGSLFYVIGKLGEIHVTSVLLYIILLANGLLIAMGFHILVLALAVLTTEIDHAILIYRDVISMGRVPIDMYREPLRSILTFVLPVAVMITFPAKIFLGLLSPWFAFLSILIGVLFLLLCLLAWRHALTRYASASS
ncbi:MAG: ABC-2 family transporter protein, partial [bacterium]|nr:ABC-2 family transporter protein [bacterium]